jgi:hypothetical protein
LYLIDEVPLSRWTDEQLADAHDHCSSCEDCSLLLNEQEVLFAEFDKMTAPGPSAAFEVQLENHLSDSKTPFSSRSGLTSALAVLVLYFGSVYQLFRESGFALSWFADGGRLESAIALIISSPALSVALVLLGLVYCLAHKNNSSTQE